VQGINFGFILKALCSKWILR